MVILKNSNIRLTRRISTPKESTKRLEGMCILGRINKPTTYFTNKGEYIIKTNGLYVLVEENNKIRYPGAEKILLTENCRWYDSTNNVQLKELSPEKVEQIKHAKKYRKRLPPEIEIFKQDNLFDIIDHTIHFNLPLESGLRLLEKKYAHLKRNKEGVDFQTNQKYY